MALTQMWRLLALKLRRVSHVGFKIQEWLWFNLLTIAKQVKEMNMDSGVMDTPEILSGYLKREGVL